MKWFSHLAVSWALGAPFGASPTVLLGATAPDWLEFLGRLPHRGVTHALLPWVLGMGLGLVLWGVGLKGQGFHLFWFAVGGISHWFTDALTVSGVPLSPWSRYRVTLLGGRLRTGEPVEYLLAGAFLLVSFVFMGWRPGSFGNQTQFSCFLIRARWCEAGEKKVKVGEEEIPLAAPAEVRRHRFEW